MTEALVGILFSVWFIIMYLLFSRLRQRYQDKRPLSAEPYPPVLRAPAQVGSARPERALTAEGLSRHHARPLNGAAPQNLLEEKTGAGASRGGPKEQGEFH